MWHGLEPDKMPDNKDLYYWVDDDGVWIEAENTPNPDRSKYRVVENFMTENAYRG